MHPVFWSPINELSKKQSRPVCLPLWYVSVHFIQLPLSVDIFQFLSASPLPSSLASASIVPLNFLSLSSNRQPSLSDWLSSVAVLSFPPLSLCLALSVHSVDPISSTVSRGGTDASDFFACNPSKSTFQLPNAPKKKRHCFSSKKAHCRAKSNFF